jgi:hypothetical protein
MDEDRLKNLFNNFNPELSPDKLFMDKLQENLDLVEIIRQHNVDLKTQNIKACIIAALVGFIVGILFSFALPYIETSINNLQSMLKIGTLLWLITNNYLIITWLAIGAVSTFIAINTYEIAISIMVQKTRLSNNLFH